MRALAAAGGLAGGEGRKAVRLGVDSDVEPGMIRGPAADGLGLTRRGKEKKFVTGC